LFASAFNVQPAKASGTIYIRADGSIDPPTAPIQRNGDVYSFTDNIASDADGIVVLRSNITIDGRGYTLQGPGTNNGFSLNVSRNRVTIRNTNVKGFDIGIWAFLSSYHNLSRNNITNNRYGVALETSSNNTIYGNNITTNTMNAVWLYSSSNNTVYENKISANANFGVYLYPNSNNNNIYGNDITNNLHGVYLASSSNNNVYGNNITANNYYGVLLYSSSNDNNVYGNSIANNTVGIYLDSSSSNNTFYHNNLVSNTQQVTSSSLSFWDDGYPSGGNYWNDYSGTDQFRGVYQNETGRDGVGDTPKPIFINSSQVDRYPLMGPVGPSTTTGENVTVFPAENVGLIFENVAEVGSTTVSETGTGPPPESGFKIEGQYLGISTTASYSGTITIRITYDETNMTQQEEESLKLMRWDETTQQWEDITTYVDVESNVIYGETSHLSIFGVHSQLIHDLSIFGVHAFKTIIGQGYPLQIFVDIRDEGDFPEDFDVTVDLVSGGIGYLSIFGVHIVSGSTTTVTLLWNTASSAKGTYSLVAHISQVPYEINMADNTYPDGTVKITISGDVNGDFFVNIQDVGLVAANWQKIVPPAPANVDINGDGRINIQDVGQLAANWQKHA
jgi:parallel beta-helix repeat protein